MIYKITSIICLILLITTSIKAQNNIDNLLLEIVRNNKSIKANQQHIVAKKLQYETGLTLKNPSIEFEYLRGSPSNIGNQTDLLVLQSFDFPTAYIKKNQVAKLQIEQTDFQLTAIRQEILLDAKQNCIELIYYNKKQAELKKRLQNADKLYYFYKKKFTNGEASVLEVKKAKLQLINLQTDLSNNTVRITQLNQKLAELNGGFFIEFNDTIYPTKANVPTLSSLIDSIKGNNPTLKSLQQEERINKKKIELSKAMALPKIEAGYRYQAILGEQYHGIHLGITIPLWENKNRVKFQEAQTLFSTVKIEDHKNQYYSKIQQLYEKYQNLNSTLIEYKQILDVDNNRELLDKSLRLGEISAIQYLMEINYFYSFFDKYLQLEKEYYLVIAELYKYQL